MENKIRIDWIDKLCGIAMICVVVSHTAIDAQSKECFYGVHMPLFFIIFGMAYGLHRECAMRPLS